MIGQAVRVVYFLLAIALDTAYSRIQVYHRRTLDSESTVQKIDRVAVLNLANETATYHAFDCIDTGGFTTLLNWRRNRRPERHSVAIVNNVPIDGSNFATVLRLNLGKSQSIYLADVGVHICENTGTSQSVKITVYQGSVALVPEKSSYNYHSGDTAVMRVYAAVAPSIASTTKIQWFNIRSNKLLSMNLRDSERVLLISNVGTDDIGRYRISIVQEDEEVLARTDIRLTIFNRFNVRSRPEFLFESDTSHQVVVGSVVVLFCEVNWFHESLSITWKKGGFQFVQNLPHVVIRTSATSTSVISTLVIYDFEISDSGNYQCSAQDLLMSLDGKATSLRAVTSSQRVQALDIPNGKHSRLSVDVNDTAIFGYKIRRSSDSPNIMCFKNGKISQTPPKTEVAGHIINCRFSFNFRPGDEGIYQCIFMHNSEMLMAPPILLGTSARSHNLRIRSNSRQVLHFAGSRSEKLTFEVTTSRSGYVTWFKDGRIINMSDSDLLFFGEIYHLRNFEKEHYGMYEVRLTPFLKQPLNRNNLVYFLATETVAPDTNLYNTPPISILEEGTDVILSCASSGEPLPSVTWTFNGSENIQASVTQRIREPSISSRTQRVIHRTRIVSLRLDSIFHTRDQGIYQCIGEAGNLSSSSTNATLAITVLEVKVTADPPGVGLGYGTTLTCTIRSVPAHSHRWTKLRTSTILPETSTTLDVMVDTVDDLEYGCEARNFFFTRTAIIKLQLVTKVPPRVEIRRNPPGTNVIDFGDTTILDCEPQEGDLPFSYFWLGPEKERLSSTRTLNVTFDAFSKYGLYACVATNSFGTSTANFMVATPAKPIVRIPSLPDVVLSELATLTAEILVNLREGLVITWLFNNKSLHEDTRYNTSVSELSSELHPLSIIYTNLSIPDVTFKDGGMYTVRAVNDIGEDSKSFFVRVQAHPNFLTPLNKTTVIEKSIGDFITFVCNATGIPTPIITWSSQPDSRISITSSTESAGNMMVATSSLSISEVQKDDIGNYTCTATTTFTSGTASVSRVYYSLIVQFSSSIIFGPTSELTCFDPISLTCHAQGYPLPNMTWNLTFTSGFKIGGVSDRNIYNFSGKIFTVSTRQTSLLDVESKLESKSAEHSLCLNFSGTMCHAANSLGRDSIAVVTYENTGQGLADLSPDAVFIVVGVVMTVTILTLLYSSLIALVIYVNQKFRFPSSKSPSSSSSTASSVPSNGPVNSSTRVKQSPSL